MELVGTFKAATLLSLLSTASQGGNTLLLCLPPAQEMSAYSRSPTQPMARNCSGTSERGSAESGCEKISCASSNPFGLYSWPLALPWIELEPQLVQRLFQDCRAGVPDLPRVSRGPLHANPGNLWATGWAHLYQMCLGSVECVMAEWAWGHK
jgi:hypothetical protein